MANRLASETSPYLLQHRDNPVDWYPWGSEAFAAARSQEKPIFLSIGYSTCHWCHVMAHESFENERIAQLLNQNFISIKVDREERPDVDDIYMTAVQSLTGSGGWPLSLFLTPDRKPFYGGTYFPPDDRYGRPGFGALLSAIADAWQTRRGDLETSAAKLAEHLATGAAAASEETTVGPAVLEASARSLASQFDPRQGGFGAAPKFPPSMRLEFLLRYWLRTGEPRAREMVEVTLSRMAAGGMYDQIGGGFHRYSVDAEWLVPHFEKMLYDNALLSRVYALAHRAFGNRDFARVARETLDYLLEEMTPAEGGFFAAQDADSGGHEGTFYVWNLESLADAVGPEAAPIVSARFGVTAGGNFEGGETVLSVVSDIESLSREFGKSPEAIAAILEEARRKMYAARGRRVRPGTDTKLLTDWTALAISALALASRLLSSPRYEAAARAAADRILRNCRRGDELLHLEKTAGSANTPGFSTDYANFVEALLDLYEATFEPSYFRAALELHQAFEERFADERGGYALATREHEGLILRPREIFDGATPSSNSVAAMNNLRLASYTGEARYRDRAEAVFKAFSGFLGRIPTALPRLLSALDYRSDIPREVVLSGEAGEARFESLREATFASPRLNRVVVMADARGSLDGVSPLVDNRRPAPGKALAYVCENFTCRQPISDPGELRTALDG
ncbi:MAG TPA: thioredoxin domain-containing protein [Thermoanaerobaculia bacterium]